jgi:enamine deaminase RidA (YjgF/YER057c/UK114 family)
VTHPELVFVGQIAPGDTALAEGLEGQTRAVLIELEVTLAARELRLDDLLRLRLFVTDPRCSPAIERALDSFAGPEWPAVSIVELSTGLGDPRVAVALDAVAAPGAHAHRRLGRQSARLGPWVFVGAISGTARRRSLFRRGRIRAQARALFTRMDELLRAQGAELGDIVKVGGWLAFPMREYGPLGEVRDELVSQAGLLPASAAVQIGRVRPDPALLAFEAIAFAPEDEAERAHARAAATPPAPSSLAPFYASARSAGGYVLTCGEVPAHRTGSGHPPGPGGSASGAAVAAEIQATEVYERLRSYLAAHGASPADVVHQTVFVRDEQTGRAAVTSAARAFFGGEIPPTTLLPAADIGFHPGCDVEIELVAATDGHVPDAR